VLLLAAGAAAPAGAAGRAAPAPGAAPAPRALAAQNPLSITYVARDCPQYTDIMANKRRNNIQESLRDLGPDSNYSSAEVVSAQKEAAGTRIPPCEPLTGWTFSTGTGYTGPKASTQNLSTVTGPIRQDITTGASTPELDAAGNPTGRTLRGAVTVPLTSAEISALNRNSLRVQGGTPAQPLNGKQEQYGFGALRCALDALNGDNIEFLNFPSGARHVFCYYYAVTPPPGAGTIRIVKHIDGAGQGDFRYDGNLSYADTNGDGVNDFVLSASTGKDASQTFVRGASDAADPWVLKEVPVAGSQWTLELPVRCAAVAADGGPGRTGFDTDSSGRVRIALVAGETATCTYANKRSGGEGLLQKESVGGTGTFDLDVTAPPGAPPIGTRPVTTTQEGVPLAVASGEGIQTGTYTLVEHKPRDPLGTWDLTSAVCDGKDMPITDNGDTWTVSHEVTADEEPQCLLTDTFTPGGEISVEKVSEGGTGTFGFAVMPHSAPREEGEPDRFLGSARTVEEGAAVLASPPGGQPGPLATGREIGTGERYTVAEYLPPSTAAGRWVAESVDCGGAEAGAPTANGTSVDITLTTAHPRPTCRFTNRFVPAGTLNVIKTTSDDTGLRPDAARLRLSCVDRTGDHVDIAPGATGGSIPEHAFNLPTSCVVTEPATGAAPEVKVSTTASLMAGDGPQRPVRLGEAFTVRPGERAVFRVANVFTGPSPSPSPSPPPSPSPSGTPAPSVSPPPPGGPGGAQLPRTGEDRYWLAPMVGIAFALLLGGGVLLRMAWLRRRRYE
jgi:LPXTG-motif cell wall-anchored protein